MLNPFRARYLIKTSIKPRVGAFIIGQSALDATAIASPPDLEPVRRPNAETVAAKSPETQYLVDHAHRRRATFGDLATVAEWPVFDRTFVDRTHLRQPT